MVTHQPMWAPREVLEGRILAVSTQSKAVTGIPGAPDRVSFAKIREPLEVPGLLDLQTDSFEWLVGSPEWRERRAAVPGSR